MNPTNSIALAALGRTYSLTPEQVDTVWMHMRLMIPGTLPSDEIRNFELAAEKGGIELRR